jgi:hypothetical protein
MSKSGLPYCYQLSLPVITFILQAASDALPPEKRREFVGLRWVNEHIFSKHPDTPYLRSRSDNDDDYNLHLCRVVELAELLYNLQTVPGIDAIFRRIVSDAEGLEGTILELEGLRLLWMAKLGFRIIHTGAGEGLRYECEVTLPNGEIAYCEMKCKIETTNFSPSTVKDSLDTARGQLPPNRCGVVIVKIPRGWFDSSWASLEAAVQAFLRNTTRVSEIILYERAFILMETHSAYPMLFKEVLNDKSPYVSRLNGGLIQDRIQTTGNTGWLFFALLTEETLKRLLEVELKEPPRQSS